MKCCRIHDVLHSFCLREAQRENLLDVINENNVDEMVRVQQQHAVMTTMSTGSDPKACCWISSQLKQLDLPITEASYKTHTSPLELEATILQLVFSPMLYFSYDEVGMFDFAPKSFPCFKLLRVLDISSRLIPEDHIPSEVENLVNLRYLALRIGGSFPDFKWFNLRSLQTIIVYATDGVWNGWASELDILDMPRLRHVYINGCFLNLPKLVQGNLQTLSWLNLPPHQGLQAKLDFEKIPNLKKLGIHIKCNLVSELPPGLLYGLSNLHKLENLKVAASYEQMSEDHFRLLTALPPYLKKLSLYHTNLSWEDMAVIGRLPNLEILKLIGYAFTGQEWETMEENEFCGLKYLQIEESGLKHWSSVHFPILECLILVNCQHLEELPDSFVDIITLHLIGLASCEPSLVSSAKEIQEERLSYGDDKLVVRVCDLTPFLL